MNADNIPSFPLRPDDRDPPGERGEPADACSSSWATIWRDLETNIIAYVNQAEALDTTRTVDVFDGAARPVRYRKHIDVGAVRVRRPAHPDILPPEMAWQAGRMHVDGVRWEADVLCMRGP